METERKLIEHDLMARRLSRHAIAQNRAEEEAARPKEPPGQPWLDELIAGVSAFLGAQRPQCQDLGAKELSKGGIIIADNYEREPGDSPGRFINRVGDGIRADLEQTYTERLVDARWQMREEQDRADADRICSDTALRSQRMAEYRRGKWCEIGGIAASAVSGFTAGFVAERQADLRPMGRQR